MRKFFDANSQGGNALNYTPRNQGHNDINQGVVDGSLELEDVFPECFDNGINEMPEDLFERISQSKSGSLSEWGVSVLPHRDYDPKLRLINAYSRRLENHMQDNGYARQTAPLACIWMFNRFRDRCSLNLENYNSANGSVPRYFQGELDLAFKAKASQVSLLTIRSFKKMPSIELGRVTIPEFRQEVVQDMNEAIDQTIGIMDGQPCKPDVEYDVVKSERTSDMKSVTLILAKQRIAILPDGTIIAKRFTFVIESDQEIAPKNVEKLFTEPDADALPPVALSVICYAYNKDAAKA